VITGKTGRKNCLVIGITRLVMRRVASNVLMMGPGCTITLRANMPIIDRKM
jgi:hypothetical protein